MLRFIKKEPVLSAALFLALLAIIFVRPAPAACLKAIDFRTIGLLFCLMIIIKAFQSQKILDYIAAKLLGLCKTKLSLHLLMVFLVFFVSMLVTNDVALLTFVPLTVVIFNKIKMQSLKCVVLETLAANLGSCITPMGNPQNLFLYSFYNFSISDFFEETLKIGIPSFLILVLMILRISGFNKNEKITGRELKNQLVHVEFNWKTILYFLNLILALFTVFRIVDYRITLLVTILVMAVCNFHLFKKVDYTLLLTFAGFFIFTGTVSKISWFSDFLNKILSTELRTYITGIAASQVISNVPASLLLSGFTGFGKELLLAVNVGGLGTLIASMASLISYKLFAASEEGKSQEGKAYFKFFTLYNVVLLILIGVLVWFLSGL